MSVPVPATIPPSPASHRPPPPQPAAARAKPNASEAAARVAPPADDDDSDADAEAEEAERVRVLQQHMEALARVKAAQEAAAAGGSAKTSAKSADKFTHHFDRKILGEGADNEMVDTSAVPTHEMNVQANCLKCRTHIFYKASTALAACHACKLLHSCVECPQCGTFFPAPTDADQIACPVCVAQVCRLV